MKLLLLLLQISQPPDDMISREDCLPPNSPISLPLYLFHNILKMSCNIFKILWIYWSLTSKKKSAAAPATEETPVEAPADGKTVGFSGLGEIL